MFFIESKKTILFSYSIEKSAFHWSRLLSKFQKPRLWDFLDPTESPWFKKEPHHFYPLTALTVKSGRKNSMSQSSDMRVCCTESRRVSTITQLFNKINDYLRRITSRYLLYSGYDEQVRTSLMIVIKPSQSIQSYFLSDFINSSFTSNILKLINSYLNYSLR